MLTLPLGCELPTVPNRTTGLLLVNLTVWLVAGRAFNRIVTVAVKGPIPAEGTMLKEVIRNGSTVNVAATISWP
jgi:hypothetical protein